LHCSPSTHGDFVDRGERVPQVSATARSRRDRTRVRSVPPAGGSVQETGRRSSDCNATDADFYSIELDVR
jgi:hypothetical protein